MDAKMTLPTTVAVATMRLLSIQWPEYLLKSKNALYESSVHFEGNIDLVLPAVAIAGPKEDIII